MKKTDSPDADVFFVEAHSVSRARAKATGFFFSRAFAFDLGEPLGADGCGLRARERKPAGLKRANATRGRAGETFNAARRSLAALHRGCGGGASLPHIKTSARLAAQDRRPGLDITLLYEVRVGGRLRPAHFA